MPQARPLVPLCLQVEPSFEVLSVEVHHPAIPFFLRSSVVVCRRLKMVSSMGMLNLSKIYSCCHRASFAVTRRPSEKIMYVLDFFLSRRHLDLFCRSSGLLHGALRMLGSEIRCVLFIVGIAWLCPVCLCLQEQSEVVGNRDAEFAIEQVRYSASRSCFLS